MEVLLEGGKTLKIFHGENMLGSMEHGSAAKALAVRA